MGSFAQICFRGRLLVAWVLLSHRLLRWFGAYAMVVALVSSVWLAAISPAIYGPILIGQLSFYSFAGIAAVEPRGVTYFGSFATRCSRFALSFVLANLAFIHATVLLLRGKRITVYAPTSH